MKQQELTARILKAVVTGLKARSEYYSAIVLPDEQKLGAPALESDLKDLEQWVGRSLPQSYRTFLGLYNGWRMASGAIDILSIQEILRGPRADSIRTWQEMARKSGDPVAARGLVIGYSEVSATKFLLDPDRQDDDGEWTMVGHDKVEEWTTPSFLSWLEGSVTDFRELLAEERSGPSA